MSRLECNLKYLSFISYKKYCLVGGVLFALALALIPHSASAMTYSTTIPSSTNSTVLMGCNSVNSDEGYLAIGPRGSLFGMDEGSKGCGYYWRDGELKYYRDNENSRGSIVFDPITGDSVNFTTPNGYVPASYQYTDYIKYGFRSVLTRWNNSFNNNGDFLIPATTDSKFGKYFVYGLIDFDTSYSSFLIPSLSLTDGEMPYRADNGYMLDRSEFINDVYSTTIFINASSMKQYLPQDIYNSLVSEYNITNDDWGDYFFIGAFLPQYQYSYYVRSLNFSVDTDLVQDSLDGQLSFHVYEVGLGNHDNLPKLNYLAFANPVYNGRNEISSWNLTDFGYNTRFRILACSDSDCLSAMSGLVNTYKQNHNNAVGSFQQNNGSNPAFSWFNVFTIHFSFPLQFIFTSFTNNQCVNIPIIAGMVHSADTSYCTWWSPSVRNVLTPAFNLICMAFITGFVVHWLSDRQSSTNGGIK